MQLPALAIERKKHDRSPDLQLHTGDPMTVFLLTAISVQLTIYHRLRLSEFRFLIPAVRLWQYTLYAARPTNLPPKTTYGARQNLSPMQGALASRLTVLPRVQRCTRCNELKETSEHYARRFTRTGLASVCRECTSTLAKQLSCRAPGSSPTAG